jgi:glycerol-3-phosphate dehydrogenase
MKRNVAQLADHSFDLLVVGGGIHGAAVLREAAVRGYKAALIEQGDFGQATSANSLKIIHGGLRYLQQGDFQRMRQSIRARRLFMQFAPHLVHPQPFLMPLYGHGLRGKEALTVGLLLNDLLSWDRNRKVSPANHLPPGQVLSSEACLALLPDLDKKGLTGGAVWHDALAANTERLTLEFILAAAERGAKAANYVKALSLVIEKGTLQGVEAQDCLTLNQFKIRAPWVINAAGPWINALREKKVPEKGRPIQWTRGLNLIIKRPLSIGYGFGLGGKVMKDRPSEAGKRPRLFFFVPWKGHTLVGTDYKRQDGPSGEGCLEIEEIRDFLDELNAVHPQGNFTLKDVSFFHSGLLPLSEGQDPADVQAEPDRHFRLFTQKTSGSLKGLVSIKSTKYTTALIVAEKVINLVSGRANNAPSKEGTTEPPDRSGSVLVEELTRSRPGEGPAGLKRTARHLSENYGPRVLSVMNLIKENSLLARSVSFDPPVLAAEIIYGIREEMALRLSDIVFRRTDLGQTGRPPRESLQTASRLMAQELGWSEERRQTEIRETLAVFGPLNAIHPLPPLEETS